MNIGMKGGRNEGGREAASPGLIPARGDSATGDSKRSVMDVDETWRADLRAGTSDLVEVLSLRPQHQSSSRKTRTCSRLRHTLLNSLHTGIITRRGDIDRSTSSMRPLLQPHYLASHLSRLLPGRMLMV